MEGDSRKSDMTLNIFSYNFIFYDHCFSFVCVCRVEGTREHSVVDPFGMMVRLGVFCFDCEKWE